MLVALLSVFFFELFEEILEEAIAYGLTELLAKTIAAVSAIALTQTAKILLKITIKKFTYKKGVDKMEYLKTFLSKLWGKMKTNPITITASGLVFPVCGAAGLGIIALFNHLGVQLPDWAIYTISSVASAIMACLVEWGVIAAGWETEAQKAFRLETKAQAKAEAQIAAEAAKALKAEQAAAEAEEKAKREAVAKAMKEAAARIKAEQEKAAAEAHEQLVKAKMAELKAQAEAQAK